MRKIILAAIMMMSWLAPAGAQSNPGFYYKFVPTAAQWNSYFAAKQDVLGYSPVNRSGDHMLGKLTMWPSADSSAGFNLNCGVAPSSPSPGDMWCDSSGIYVRVGTTTIGPLIDSSFTPTGNLPGVTGVGTLTSGATGAGFTIDLGASTISGTLPSANSGAISGDMTKSAGSATSVVSKVNGVSYQSSATADQVAVGVSANTTNYKSVPNCTTSLTYSTSTHAFSCNASTGAPIAGYLNGLQETWASTTTITTSAGSAASNDAAVIMTLPSAMTKSMSSWSAGTAAGCLDAGTIAANTTYHFYLIYDPTTPATDVACSTSASAPTFGGNIPSSYTKYRRIFSLMTNGSTQWTKVFQSGDEFFLDVPVQDYSQANPGTAALSIGLTVPIGIQVFAKGVVGNICGTSLGTATLVSSLAMTDSSPISSGPNSAVCAVNGRSTGPMFVQTNTSGAIRLRTQQSDANTTIYVNTFGWIDQRGRS